MQKSADAEEFRARADWVGGEKSEDFWRFETTRSDQNRKEIQEKGKIIWDFKIRVWPFFQLIFLKELSKRATNFAPDEEVSQAGENPRADNQTQAMAQARRLLRRKDG